MARSAQEWLRAPGHVFAAGSANLRARTDDHDFRRLDQSCRKLPFLQTQIAARIAGDDRGDGLAADVERDFGHQTGDFDFGDTANELVSPADEVFETFGQFPTGRWFFPGAFSRVAEEGEAIDFGARNAVVSTGSADGLYFAMIDPLFDGRVAHSQLAGGIVQFKEVHFFPPGNPIRFQVFNLPEMGAVFNLHPRSGLTDIEAIGEEYT